MRCFKKSCRIILAGIAFALTGLLRAEAAEEIKLNLDWVVGGTHAGYFAAKEKNFYGERGLDVTISRGFGSGDTVKRVATGAATIGIADTATIIAARANDDVPVRIVGMIYDNATIGLIYLRESGIKQPKDLIGRTIGRSASGASVNMFPAFLNVNKIDRASLKELVTDGASFMPLLLTGRVDAVLEQSIHLAKFMKGAAEQGKTAAAMRYSEFGLPTYGNAIFVHPDTLAKNPDMVRKFVEASLMGIAWAFDFPDEAVAIVRKTNPEIDAAATKGELLAHKDVQNSADVRQHGFGYVNEKRMNETIDVVTPALTLKRRVSFSDLFVPGYLPKNRILPQGQ